MKDDIKLFYDLTAEKTADEWYGNDILMPTIKDFFALLPANPRILDLGCGPGHESMRLASAGAEVLGIDFSPECIRVARERCQKCSFEVMDFFNLGCGIGEFDGIFASGSLIHIEHAQIGIVIKNAADILRANGCFLMIVQDGEGIKEKWSNFEVHGRNIRRPVYCYTKNSLTDASVRAGLQFLREGYLDDSLYGCGWRNYIFRKNPSRI